MIGGEITIDENDASHGHPGKRPLSTEGTQGLIACMLTIEQACVFLRVRVSARRQCRGAADLMSKLAAGTVKGSMSGNFTHSHSP